MTGRNAVRRQPVMRALMRPEWEGMRRVKIPTPVGELTGSAALLYWREVLGMGQAEPPADPTEDEDPFYADPAEREDPESFELIA